MQGRVNVQWQDLKEDDEMSKMRLLEHKQHCPALAVITKSPLAASMRCLCCSKSTHGQVRRLLQQNCFRRLEAVRHHDSEDRGSLSELELV